jgi:hypothetical protein
MAMIVAVVTVQGLCIEQGQTRQLPVPAANFQGAAGCVCARDEELSGEVASYDAVLHGIMAVLLP